MDPTVRATHITKIHQVGNEQVHTLNDISLEIFPGEMVAIRARPNSGKSTLLYILGGMQRPDSGQVLIDDVDVTQLQDDELARLRAQKVGFVFEAFNLLTDETAVRNVQVPLRNQGFDPAESYDMAEAALQIVGLGNRLEYTPGQLSPRQRQCIAIARALANDPSILFADEPTRDLDSSSREEIIGLLQKLNDEGKTIVLATADSGVASHCRRVVRLAEGKAQQDSLLAKRRIIPAFRVPGPIADSQVSEEETVCPRCNFGSPQDEETCQRCTFPLHLTPEETQSIELRLSGTESRLLGVESAIDDIDEPHDNPAAQRLIEDLKEIPCFADLSSRNLLKIISALEKYRFPEGNTIVKQGDPGDSFYIVRSGNVQVILERPGQGAAAIASLGPNEAFGEMSLLTGQPRSANVITMTTVEVWRLPKEAFDGLVGENLSMAVYFNRILSQRLMALQERMIH